MKIRALANGNVIEAHEDAAKILIDAKIYERVSDKEPLTASLTPPVSSAVAPLTTADLPKKPKRGKK